VFSCGCQHCNLKGTLLKRFCLVLQGMLQSSALGQYYLDLQNPKFKTAFAIYHRRYSTNTNPKWPLAQPMRLLGHNGEPKATLH
jgi:glutamate synthase domain-containing protein 1